DIFRDPWHPYTKLLIMSIPGIKVTRGGRLESIKGTVPNPLNFPKGCRFAPRCPWAMDICKDVPPEEMVVGNRRVSCHLRSQGKEAK
ncbi:MAG: peptide ABC transporter ATP-binding protein, partial [Firmicutes bacterium]|nr:peptide ABC transporter ATP-binding protein [Bacillota bacterium]